MTSTPHEPVARDSGDESTWVVFLHGQPGTAEDWQQVISELPPDIRTLTLDRPGYASNPAGPSDIDGNAEWLLSQLDEHGIDEAILVGHSYGGGIALAAAALAPERVSGLALVASVGPDCLDGWDAVLASPFLGPFMAIFALRFLPSFARWRLSRIERRRGQPVGSDEYVALDILGKARHEHGSVWRTFVHEQRVLVRNVDQFERYADSIDAPAVLITDPRDKVVPLSTAHALRERLHRARLVLAPGGGHNLPRRKPDVIAREIADLARTPR